MKIQDVKNAIIVEKFNDGSQKRTVDENVKIVQETGLKRRWN